MERRKFGGSNRAYNYSKVISEDQSSQYFIINIHRAPQSPPPYI